MGAEVADPSFDHLEVATVVLDLFRLLPEVATTHLNILALSLLAIFVTSSAMTRLVPKLGRSVACPLSIQKLLQLC